MKRVYISSSISNFRRNLRSRYWDYAEFQWFSKDPTLFFGMYHIGDYLRLILHGGHATIFWCGSDILQIKKSLLWRLSGCRNVVENVREQRALSNYGIMSEIHPMLFDNPNKYSVTYEPSDTPTVWLTYHLGREEEYGVWRFLDIARQVPELRFRFFNGATAIRDFDEITSKYQATVRFNEFDGASENMTKALLRGQYVFTVIPYPHVESFSDEKELVELLKDLKNRKEVNPAEKMWREILTKRVEV